jgi:hypothetical protein
MEDAAQHAYLPFSVSTRLLFRAITTIDVDNSFVQRIVFARRALLETTS